jgi:hypothetical protein
LSEDGALELDCWFGSLLASIMQDGKQCAPSFVRFSLALLSDFSQVDGAIRPEVKVRQSPKTAARPRSPCSGHTRPVRPGEQTSFVSRYGDEEKVR